MQITPLNRIHPGFQPRHPSTWRQSPRQLPSPLSFSHRQVGHHLSSIFSLPSRRGRRRAPWPLRARAPPPRPARASHERGREDGGASCCTGAELEHAAHRGRPGRRARHPPRPSRPAELAASRGPHGTVAGPAMVLRRAPPPPSWPPRRSSVLRAAPPGGPPRGPGAGAAAPGWAWRTPCPRDRRPRLPPRSARRSLSSRAGVPSGASPSCPAKARYSASTAASPFSTAAVDGAGGGNA